MFCGNCGWNYPGVSQDIHPGVPPGFSQKCRSGRILFIVSSRITSPNFGKNSSRDFCRSSFDDVFRILKFSYFLNSCNTFLGGCVQIFYRNTFKKSSLIAPEVLSRIRTYILQEYNQKLLQRFPKIPLENCQEILLEGFPGISTKAPPDIPPGPAS